MSVRQVGMRRLWEPVLREGRPGSGSRSASGSKLVAGAGREPDPGIILTPRFVVMPHLVASSEGEIVWTGESRVRPSWRPSFWRRWLYALPVRRTPLRRCRKSSTSPCPISRSGSVPFRAPSPRTPTRRRRFSTRASSSCTPSLSWMPHALFGRHSYGIPTVRCAISERRGRGDPT
jgi:hypothetical protein